MKPNIGGDRWMDYKAIPPLKGPSGLQITPYNSYPMANGVFVITSACDNPELHSVGRMRCIRKKLR